MNQILAVPTVSHRGLRFFFKFQFFVCILICIFCLGYYVHFFYYSKKTEEFSQKLVSDFTNTSLYSSSLVETPTKTYVSDSAFVLGIIEIDSISIQYPVLSDYNEDLLKLSPCKFYGPMPNEIGNLCIAGHNYHNNTFFSNLKNLKLGDIISFYDSLGNKLDYSIYDIYVVNANDLSCTNQNTNGTRQITLITCDSSNRQKRVIVKAKEIE